MLKWIRSALFAASLLAAYATAADQMSHGLAVTGVVENPLALSVADLRQLPAANSGKLDVTRHSGNEAETLASYRGVRLRDILDKAVLDAPAHNDMKKLAIIATATDGYVAVFSWGELYNSPAGEGVVVYYEKNGKALGEGDGEIALISARDTRTGPRHVKWLKAIEVRKLAD